jgi:hypothetical protein
MDVAVWFVTCHWKFVHEDGLGAVTASDVHVPVNDAALLVPVGLDVAVAVLVGASAFA